MVLIPVSQCAKSLDFGPSKPLPQALPPFAVRDGERAFLVSGFDRTDGDAVVLVGQIHELLSALYPSLTAPETARLAQQLGESLGFELRDAWLSLQGLRASDELVSLLAKVASSPRLFQDWVAAKGISLRELTALTLASGPAVDGFCIDLARSPASKAQGVAILELWCELAAMKTAPAAVQLSNPEAALKELQALRSPRTSARDTEAAARLKTIAWPAHTQARWVRQGDQAGIEIKFHLYSELDLERQLQGLTKVREHLSKDLWNRH
ncbi:MAG TPA: hypothetical protein VFV50_13240 [Bdellovibrionales bacterium]|nr:hypothetical protein [Bdellovibrionales bacterium]